MWCRFSLQSVLYFFLLAIVLSVHLRITASNYPFGILKLSFCTLCDKVLLGTLKMVSYFLHKYIYHKANIEANDLILYILPF